MYTIQMVCSKVYYFFNVSATATAEIAGYQSSYMAVNWLTEKYYGKPAVVEHKPTIASLGRLLLAEDSHASLHLRNTAFSWALAISQHVIRKFFA